MPSHIHPTRVLARFKRQLQHGEFYDAHQQLRTFASRLLKDARVDDAHKLLLSAIHALLDAQQSASALDLACLMVDQVYVGHKSPDAQSLGQLVDILVKVPVGEPQHRVYIAKCVRWTESDTMPHGSPQLNHLLGILFWKDDKFQDAEKRFLVGTRSDSPAAWAKMLFSACVNRTEELGHDNDRTAGQYLARAVLQYLARGDHRSATLAYRTFTSLLTTHTTTARIQRDPDVEESTTVIVYPDDRWLNLCMLLVEVTRRDARDAYALVKDVYRAECTSDAVVTGWIARIGQVYFAVPPPQQPQLPIQQLMASLFAAQ